MSRVRDVLNSKGSDVATIDREAMVQEAVMTMHRRHIGSVVVMSGAEIVGIFTERDVLNRVVAAGKDPGQIRVREVMTPRVAFCEPQTPLSQCRTAMTRNRIRHLPVLENGKLVGIISSGDILARELEDTEEQIRYLHEYMHGTY